MRKLRRSFSSQNGLNERKDERKSSRNLSATTTCTSHPSPSLDTLVVHGRSRYPLTPFQTPKTSALDISVAHSLLSEGQKESGQRFSKLVHGHESPRNASTTRLNNASNSCSKLQLPNSSRHTSTNLSGVSRSTSACLSFADTPNVNAELYIHKYDDLAKRFGLPPLEVKAPKGHPQQAALRPDNRGSFFDRFKRKGLPEDSVVDDSRIVRKNSVTSLMGNRPKISLDPKSLDQLCRLGGLSILYLPPKLTAVPLEVPTCIAATGNYLVQHAIGAEGLFRLSGRTNVVNRLYEHFVSQIHDASQERQKVQEAVGHALLPQTALDCDVHDVACVFKKFLQDLPGGILGSAQTYETLGQLTNHDPVVGGENAGRSDSHGPRLSDSRIDWHSIRPRMMAFALLAIPLRRQRLCAAIFGLLAALCGQTLDPAKVDDIRPPLERIGDVDNMKCKTLSILFAPVLVKIPKTDAYKRGVSAYLRSPRARKCQQHQQPEDNISQINASLDHYNAAAKVIEMVINEWEIIAYHMKRPFARRTSVSVSSARQARRSQPSTGRLIPNLEPIQSPRQTPDTDTSMVWPETSFAGTSEVFTRASEPSLSSSKRKAKLKELSHLRQVKSSTLLATDLPSDFVHQDHGGSEEDAEAIPKVITQPMTRKPIPVRGGTSSPPIVATSEMLPQGETPAWWEASRNKARESCDSEPHDNRQRLRISYSTYENNTGKGEGAPRVVESESVSSSTAQELPHIQTGPVDDEVSVSNPPYDNWVNAPTCTGLSTDLTSYLKCHLNTFSEPRRLSKDHESTKFHIRAKTSQSEPRKLQRSRIPRLQPTHVIAKEQEQDQHSIAKGEMLEVTLPTHANNISGAPLISKHCTTRIPPPSSSILPQKENIDQSKRHNGVQSLEQPEVAKRINFTQINTNLQQKENPFRSTSADVPLKGNVGTLFAEIHRLKMELDSRNEAVLQLTQELRAIRAAKDTAALSERLRESERELKIWKHRALWAETAFVRRELVSRNTSGGQETSVDG